MPRAQVVRTFAGWHGRVLADNGEPLWTTEVLSQRAYVVHAYQLLGQLCFGGAVLPLPNEATLIDVDERGLDDG